MMVATVETMFVAYVVELLSLVWMEVSMAGLAALVWLTVSGIVVVPKAAKKVDHVPVVWPSSGRVSPSTTGAQQPTPPQLAAQALREGRLGDAMVLLKQMPEVPVSIAPRLLMAVAKAPNFEDTMVELQVFAGKIEARALEAAILEAIQDKDVCACRQLQALASPMLITKSARTLEALARVHASDIDVLRVLVNEADAPLAKSFAGAVLEACAALRDVDLAFEVFDKAAETDAAALRAVTEKASKLRDNFRTAKFSQIGISRRQPYPCAVPVQRGQLSTRAPAKGTCC